jgi:hypothetical protein
MPVTATMVAGGVQGVLGAVQSISGSIRAKRLSRRLRPFKTPNEAYKVLNATEQAAQSGYDPTTLKYLTDNIGKSTAASLGAATRLGANPNQLSAILDNQIEQIMRVGAGNHQLQMTSFSRYLGALEMVGKNKEAEWASEQNILKNQIQQASQDKRAGMQNAINGVNAVLAGWSTKELQDMGNGDFTGQKAAGGNATGGATGNDTSSTGGGGDIDLNDDSIWVR